MDGQRELELPVLLDPPREELREAIRRRWSTMLDLGAMEEVRALLAADRFLVKIRDNGPGIVREQIPKVFGKLLYGSKFHRYRQSRGQQGIGISAAGMYGLLTTGRPVAIISKTGPRKPAHAYEIAIDTRRNRPEILREDVLAPAPFEQGTEVGITLEAEFLRGKRSVDEYLELTALANPHATLLYHPPKGDPARWPRVSRELRSISAHTRLR